MQKIAKLTNEMVQRALCRVKPQAYFLHSQQTLPSILLVSSQHQQALKPLLRILTTAEKYPLLATIEKHTVKGPKGTVGKPMSAKSIQGIELTPQALLIRIGQQGNLKILPKQELSQGQIVGALLFTRSKDTVISHGHNVWMQNAVFLVRLTAVFGLWQLCIALQQSTRPQNHAV